MQQPRVRFSVRWIMGGVALIAALLGTYMYGMRQGEKAPMVRAHDRALRVVRSLPITSDEEACAVYYLSLSHENKEPGFLADYSKVTSKNIGNKYEWSVIFASPKNLPAYEEHYTIDARLVGEYRKVSGKD